jgi:hypothetical protein
MFREWQMFFWWTRNGWFLLHVNTPEHRPLVVESAFQAQHYDFGASTLFSGLVTSRLSLLPRIKSVLKENDSRAPRKSLQTRGEHWKKYRKRGSRTAGTLAKACHFPREPLCRECCVNRCNVHNIVHLHHVAHCYFTSTFLFRLCAAYWCFFLKHF